MHLPFWGAFQHSLTLLIRYRSRGVFSLRGQCPRYSRGISNPRYSGADTRSTGRRYGTVTLYRTLFQGISRRRSSAASQSEHHIAHEAAASQASVWTVSGSLAVTNDIALLSFPVDTEMFQFSTFPIAPSNCKEDSYSEIPSSFPPCGSLGLIAAWHVLLQLSSRAIHQLAQ